MINSNSNDGQRQDINGWIYLQISGSPYQRGYQHGQLVAPEIKDALRVIAYLITQSTGSSFGAFQEAALSLFATKLDEEYRAEIQGIADGSGQSFEDILTWNAYPELICNWWPSIGGKGTGEIGEHCSAFIATGNATVDGNIVLAHTTWQLYSASDSYNVILDIMPETGHRIIMQSVPGYICSSTDFALTGAGLGICETTLSGFSAFDPEGLPEFQRMRKACQYAHTIEEWVSIMKTGNNGGYANTWLLGDIHTKRIARLELGLKYTPLTIQSEGCYGGFNSAIDPVLRNLECGGDPGYNDIRKASGARRVRWQQLFEQYHGQISRAVAKNMISDTYDVYLEKNNPSCRTIDGHLEVDRQEFGGGTLPYYPWGSADGKVADSDMIRNLQIEARWGHPCGTPFNADGFFQQHIQYDWLKGYMKNRPVEEWTSFGA